MIIRVTAVAAAAALGLLASACNKPAETPPAPPEQTPVAEQPAAPTPDPFATAVNFACDGGGAVEIAFGAAGASFAFVRIDGGPPLQLTADEQATNGMIYRDANVSVLMEGDGLKLTSGGTAKTCKFVSRALPAPTVEGVVRDLKAEDAGAAVEMKVGEKISVSLSGVPTAGYLWAAETPPAFVKISEGPGGATSTSQLLPGFTGGNHWEVLVVEAMAPGEGELVFVQKRPWEEKADPADQRLKFRLTVK